MIASLSNHSVRSLCSPLTVTVAENPPKAPVIDAAFTSRSARLPNREDEASGDPFVIASSVQVKP